VRWLLPVFALAVLARILGQLVLGSFVQPDTFEYEAIATNLVTGHGYTYASPDGGIYVASQSSPLYILLTAGVYAISDHSQTLMLVLQALLGGMTAALTAWLAARVFSRAVGVIAGVLVAADPALIFYASELHSLTLDALANVALVCATIAFPPRPTARNAVSYGALFGLAALTRATALVLLPLHVAWLGRQRVMRLMSLPVGLMFLAAIVVYAPWPVRNSVLLDQLTLGSSEATEWFWRGNNPNANGGSLASDQERMLDLAPADFRAQIAAADESERIRLYRDAALRYIASNPTAALELYVAKLGTFWWGSDQTGILYPAVYLVGYRIWYVLALIVGAPGVLHSRTDQQQRAALVLILGTALIVSLSQAMFYVEGRHRVAIEPLLLVYTAAGLTWLYRRAAEATARSRPLAESSS
jgi:4-amino-4-deoxy-L-arabinose transferase-like glycosyltransferase